MSLLQNVEVDILLVNSELMASYWKCGRVKVENGG